MLRGNADLQIVEPDAEVEGHSVDRPLVLGVEADAGRLPLRLVYGVERCVIWFGIVLLKR